MNRNTIVTGIAIAHMPLLLVAVALDIGMALVYAYAGVIAAAFAIGLLRVAWSIVSGRNDVEEEHIPLHSFRR